MRAVVSLLLLAGLSLGSEAPNNFDWAKFGRASREHMPAEMKKAAPLRQAHYVAEQVADKLLALGIPPNYDQPGRNRSQRRFNDSHLGTCGHTAECLKQAWQGAGLAAKSAKSLVVLKRQPNGKLLDEINADHVAMVYLDRDGPVVFDLWCHGRTHSTFAGFRTSVWKGMPVAEWARRMEKEGYTVSSISEHSEMGELPPARLPELVRKIPLK
jgi:hypothetical protein